MCQKIFFLFSATRGRYFGMFSHFFALFLLFSDLSADFITRMVCTQLKLYFPCFPVIISINFDLSELNFFKKMPKPMMMT